MSLTIQCDHCKQELDEPGALLFSPPYQSFTQGGEVVKYHLCRSCWLKIIRWVLHGEQLQ